MTPMRVLLKKLLAAVLLVGLVGSSGAAFHFWNRGLMAQTTMSVVAGFACLLFLYALLVNAHELGIRSQLPSRSPSAVRSDTTITEDADWSNPHWQRYGESLLDFKTKVVGVKHKNADGTSRQHILSRCRVGERLVLLRDHDNPVDENAVKVCREDGSQIGHLSEFRAAQLAPVLDRGFEYEVVIEDLRAGPSGELGCNIALVTVGRGGLKSQKRDRSAVVV